MEEDQDILPGGDPDAGMPADQARIHGIERGPHITEQSAPLEQYLPAEDSLPVDVETHVDDTSIDFSTVNQQQQPDSD